MRHAATVSLVGLLACGDADGRGSTSLSGGVGTATATAATTGADDPTTSGAVTTGAADSTDPTTGADPGSTTTTDPTATGSADTSTGDAPNPGATCPPVGAPDCSPGPGTGKGAECFDAPSCFLPTVKSAVTATLDAHPEWFDYADGQPLVLDVEAYMNTVVETVSAQELCAIRDPNAGDEIAVKHDQSGAENFDILTADGHARYGDGIYTSVCAPSWF